MGARIACRQTYCFSGNRGFPGCLPNQPSVTGCQGAEISRLPLVMFPASAARWVICAREAPAGSTTHRGTYVNYEEVLSQGTPRGAGLRAGHGGSRPRCLVRAGAELRGVEGLPALPFGRSIGVMSCPGVRPRPRRVRRRRVLKGSERGARCGHGYVAHPPASESNDSCHRRTAACQLGPCRLSRDGCDRPSAARTPRWLFPGTQPGLSGPWGRCWGVWMQTASRAHQLLLFPSLLLCRLVLAVRVGRSSQARGARTCRRWPHVS